MRKGRLFLDRDDATKINPGTWWNIELPINNLWMPFYHLHSFLMWCLCLSACRTIQWHWQQWKHGLSLCGTWGGFLRRRPCTRRLYLSIATHRRTESELDMVRTDFKSLTPGWLHLQIWYDKLCQDKMAEDVKQKIEEIQNQKIPGEIQRVSGGLKSNLTKSKDRKMEMLVFVFSI